MKPLKKTIILILILVLVGCITNLSTRDSPENAIFERLFSNCSMNKIVQFLPVRGETKSKSLIHLSFQNQSQDSVIFPPDNNIQILIYDSDSQSWLEVKNDMQYFSIPEQYVIVEPLSNGITSYSGITIFPITLSDVPVEVRAVITGHVYKNNVQTEECVGAFIDLLISP